MRRVIKVLIIILLLVSSASIHAQLSRRNQIELYSGFAFPQKPQNFKDYWKVGLSINAQYVIFPTNRLGIPIFIGLEGFTVNNDAISNSFSDALEGFRIYNNNVTPVAQITSASVETEGSAGDIKLGFGLRPYLTSSASSIQLFLFGNVSYNIISIKTEFKSATITLRDLSTSDVATASITSAQLEAEDFNTVSEKSEGKLGMGLGIGMEIPAGGSINLIFQGMANVIFAKYEELQKSQEEEYISFIGLTFGIAF